MSDSEGRTATVRQLEPEDYFAGSDTQHFLGFSNSSRITQRASFPAFFESTLGDRYPLGGFRGQARPFGSVPRTTPFGHLRSQGSLLSQLQTLSERAEDPSGRTQQATAQNLGDLLPGWSPGRVRATGDRTGLGFVANTEASGTGPETRESPESMDITTALLQTTDDAPGAAASGSRFFSSSGVSDKGVIGGSVVSGLSSTAGGAISSGINMSKDLQMQASKQSFDSSQQKARFGQENTLQQNEFQQQSAMSSQKYQQELGLQNNQYQNSLNFYNTQMANTQNSLTQAGLPSYLAYMPQAVALQPKTTQMSSSGMYGYTAKIPGNPTTSPYTGTTTQSALGWGTFPS